SPSGSTAVARVRASVDISPRPHRTRIAGRIIAFTLTTTTTGSLAGPTTTHLLPSTGGCTRPGMTSMSGEVPSLSAIQLTTVSLGPRSEERRVGKGARIEGVL